MLRGGVRAFDDAVRRKIAARIREVCEGVARSSGTDVRLEYRERYPATRNAPEEAGVVRSVIEATFGAEALCGSFVPAMASEDFAFMLERRPGCFALLGSGTEATPLHNPRYDFDDRLLELGIRYWVSLVQRRLPPA